MEYEIRNPDTAKIFFWAAQHQCWLDVISCGDSGISGWVQTMKRVGIPICHIKGRVLAPQEGPK